MKNLVNNSNTKTPDLFKSMKKNRKELKMDDL